MSSKHERPSAIAAEAETHLYEATRALERLGDAMASTENTEIADGANDDLYNAVWDSLHNSRLRELITAQFFQVRGLRMTLAQLEVDHARTAPISARIDLATNGAASAYGAVPADEPAPERKRCEEFEETGMCTHPTLAVCVARAESQAFRSEWSDRSADSDCAAPHPSGIGACWRRKDHDGDHAQPAEGGIQQWPQPPASPEQSAPSTGTASQVRPHSDSSESAAPVAGVRGGSR